MKKQFKVEGLVKEILTIYKEAREDDFILVAEFYYKLCPDITNMTFSAVLLARKELGLPSFESITRARRKMQAMYPELCSTKTKERRKMLEKEYREHYVNYERSKIYDR